MCIFIYTLTSAAAAKLLQLCLTLCNPIDNSPPGPAVPGILQARTLEWVAISSLSNKHFKLVLHQDSMSCTLKVEERSSSFSDMMFVQKIDAVVCW